MVRDINQKNGKTEKPIGTQNWLDRMVLLANTDDVYGLMVPFRDSGMEKA